MFQQLHGETAAVIFFWLADVCPCVARDGVFNVSISIAHSCTDLGWNINSPPDDCRNMLNRHSQSLLIAVPRKHAFLSFFPGNKGKTDCGTKKGKCRSAWLFGRPIFRTREPWFLSYHHYPYSHPWKRVRVRRTLHAFIHRISTCPLWNTSYRQSQGMFKTFIHSQLDLCAKASG